MDNEKIITLEIEGLDIIQDENGNIINTDENEEVNSMGKGEEDEQE